MIEFNKPEGMPAGDQEVERPHSKHWNRGRVSHGSLESQRILTYQPTQIYLDETRQERGGEGIFAVSAYVVNFESAVALEAEWLQALAANGVPAFHGKDLRSPCPPPPYDGWTQQQRDRFVVRLAEVARDHMVAGLGCAIRERDFVAVVPKSLPGHLRDFLSDPHALCLNVIFGMCLQSETARQEGQARLYLQPPYGLLHDDKRKFAQKSKRVWQWRQLQDPQGGLLRAFDLGDDKAFPLLQVADLLAYYCARMIIDPETRGAAAQVDQVLRSRGDRLGFLPLKRERIQEFVDLLFEQPSDNFKTRK